MENDSSIPVGPMTSEEIRAHQQKNDAMDAVYRRLHELGRENAALEAENKANQAQLELHKLASGGKSCKRCAELEQRIEKLQTDSEARIAEMQKKRRQEQLAYNALRKRHTQVVNEKELLQRGDDYLKQQYEHALEQIADFDRTQERNGAEAQAKMAEALRLIELSHKNRVMSEGEIWRSVAERLGLKLRTGYVICEDEIVAAFELERERASQVKAKFEELARRYELVKREAASLQLEAPKLAQLPSPAGDIPMQQVPQMVQSVPEKQEVPNG